MNKKTQKMTLLTTVFILLTSICCINSTMAVPVHSIKGVLYINGEIASENIIIYLEFPTGTENTTTYVFDIYDDNTNYNIGFWDHGEETGYFKVEINGGEIIPEDNQSIYIENGVTGYIMDLHIIVETPENNPPDKPVNPDPENNSENVNINPVLSVTVSDPDDDAMIVSFFDASDDSLIGTVTDVANGNIAYVTWSDLEYNTIYSWYVKANDSEFENKSETWSFTTEKEAENKPPTVEITKPENALYLFNIKIRNHRLQFRKPLIFGRITIEANATDEDSGIEKVEFYINGNLMGNDTNASYTYNWTRDHIRLIHRFTIKVVAYDNEGATAEDSMVVRKFL